MYNKILIENKFNLLVEAKTIAFTKRVSLLKSVDKKNKQCFKMCQI